MTREAFHSLMIDPTTPARLDAMIADCARVDRETAARGPHPCCPDFGTVVFCTGDEDTWECLCCHHTWAAPCR